MGRRDSIYSLARTLFEANAFVIYPDHPVLVKGPDILARTEGGLVACFVKTRQSSRPQSAAESVRVLLSRFALPLDTTFVLVVVGVNSTINEDAFRLFDEVRFLSSGDDQAGTVEHTNSGAKDLVAMLRPFHLERFAEAWTGSSRQPEQGSGRTTYSMHHLSYQRAPDWINVSGNHVTARLNTIKKWDRLTLDVQTLANKVVSDDFGLMAGLSGLERTLNELAKQDAHLAHHELTVPTPFPAPQRSGDPLKFLRAAAFAGAFVNYENEVN